jgi:microcystin-dependent protein
MLANFVEEQASSPGTGTSVNLAGAPTGRVTWRLYFTDGATVFYCISDGTQAEWGIGTVTYGSPDTLARTTVLKNTVNTTSRLNFTGACRVYNECPAERLLYINQSGYPSMDSSYFQLPAWGGTATGIANALNIALTPAPTALSIGMVVRFLVGAGLASTGPTTLNVNGLGAKSLMKRRLPYLGSTYDLGNGDIVVAELVEAVYDGTNWRLLHDTGSSSIPIGAVVPYSGLTAPPGFILADGSNKSRSAYANLHAVYSAAGYPYGTGNGSTTFGIPDCRGRALIGKDDMGGSTAGRVTAGISGITGTTLGNAGGSQLMHQHLHAVVDPTHDHAASTTGGDHTHSYIDNNIVLGPVLAGSGSGYKLGTFDNTTGGTGSHTHSFTSDKRSTGITISNMGDGSSQNMPPSIVQLAMIYAGA